MKFKFVEKNGTTAKYRPAVRVNILALQASPLKQFWKATALHLVT